MSKLPFFDYFRENILITQKKGVKCTFVLLFMNPALLYRSRQGDARPPLASRSEYGDASTPTSSKGVSLNELQEGDVLLLRGRRFDSTVIATMSDGVSHCGQMIKFEEWEASSEMMTYAFKYDENKSPGNLKLFEISLKGLTCMEN